MTEEQPTCEFFLVKLDNCYAVQSKYNEIGYNDWKISYIEQIIDILECPSYQVWLYWSLVIMKMFHFPITFHYNGLHCNFKVHTQQTPYILPFARQVPLVEQELLTILQYMSSTTIFTEVCVVQSLVFCVAFCKSLFVLFLLAILLSVLRYTTSDYTYGIIKIFFH